ncbi:MAG TPA: hypothetical protein VKX25_18460 [Bryobacteraceae bacterium]|nr:hypothetical protein [Bryobacteraceae bacterium]
MSHARGSAGGGPKPLSEAIAVLLTFTTYGTHLHGAETGSVSRRHRNRGAPTVPDNPAFRRQARQLMSEPEFTLELQDRAHVLKAIHNACEYRGWHFFAVHVRTNHVHVVFQPDVPLDRALAYLESPGYSRFETGSSFANPLLD